MKNLVAIIFPEFCVGCNKFGTLLCYTCYEKLEFLQFDVYPENSCQYLNSITCSCYYEGIAKKLVHELKYMSVIAVGKTLADILYYTTSPPNFDVITFVPMHKKKVSQRGFNQAQVVAIELGKLYQKPVADLLQKTKKTRSQMSISVKKDRQKNIEETIQINPQVLPKFTQLNPTVLIVDDVFTSGTTLNYCAQILKNFGFHTVQGICFAHEG